MKNLAFIYSDDKFKSQIEYVANTIFEAYEINLFVMHEKEFKNGRRNFDLCLYYGDNTGFEGADVIIPGGGLFSDKYLDKASILNNVEYFQGLPVFFRNLKYDFYVKQDARPLVFNIDLLQTAFYFLSCYEEYVINEYDKNGRFIIDKSTLYKNNLLGRPVVNETIEKFIDILNQSFSLDIKGREFWGDKKFAAALTHDVDAVEKYYPVVKELRLLLSMAIVDKKYKEILKRIKGYMNIKVLKRDRDPFDTFDYILELEKKYGFRSSFYFMTDRSGNYSVKDEGVIKKIQKILLEGSEVGFHPGLGTSGNEGVFMSQFKKLAEVLPKNSKIGIRQHFLSFRVPDSWEIQNKCCAVYDTTVCFPQHAGFKTGYCLPYRPYDLKENKVLDIWEIPLIVMEGSLLDYMKLDYEACTKYIIQLVNYVEKFRGVFVLLWHNSSICKDYNPISEELFKWFYEYIHDRDCMVESNMNIIEKYTQGLGNMQDDLI